MEIDTAEAMLKELQRTYLQVRGIKGIEILDGSRGLGFVVTHSQQLDFYTKKVIAENAHPFPIDFIYQFTRPIPISEKVTV